MTGFSFSLASEVDKIHLTGKKKPQMALRKASEFQNIATSLSKDFFFISLAKEEPHWIHKLEDLI